MGIFITLEDEKENNLNESEGGSLRLFFLIRLVLWLTIFFIIIRIVFNWLMADFGEGCFGICGIGTGWGG